MKTIHHFILLALTSMAFAVQAQNCTPDTTIKVPGFYPNKLADGNVGTPYSQTVMVLSFKDTSVVVGGSKQNVTIDSLKLTKVIGLPTGMGYVCYEPRCIYLPTKVRCIKLNGTPTQSGVFPLKFAEITEIRIYNRWGEEVFKTEDPYIGWNGKVNNTGKDCSDGVYLYAGYYYEQRLGGLVRQPLSGEKKGGGFIHLIRGK